MKNEKIESQNLFWKNLRKCSLFCPENFVVEFQDGDGKKVFYLYTKYRILWALTWAKENDVKLTYLTEICNELTDNEKVTFKCNVLLDSEIIGTGYASELYSYNSGVNSDSLKNVAIETAETRSIGRALARAGFGICADGNESKELQPCESIGNEFKPASTVQRANMSTKTVLSDPYEIRGEDDVEKLVNAYKANYPCNPHKNLHFYELEYNRSLIDNLIWIKENFPKENVVKWACFMLEFISSDSEIKKQIHLKARLQLKKEKLIK